MSICIRPRAGPSWPLALPMIPYMLEPSGEAQRARTRERRESPSAAGSPRTCARGPSSRDEDRNHSESRERGRAGDRIARRGRGGETRGPYALYIGKLAPNKGTSVSHRGRRQGGSRLAARDAGDGPIARAPRSRGEGVRQKRRVQRLGRQRRSDAPSCRRGHADLPVAWAGSLSRVLSRQVRSACRSPRWTPRHA